MRIAFFGLPLAALALTARGHDVVLAAICREGAPGTRRLARQLGRERMLVRPVVDDPSFLARVAGLGADLVVSWFWTTRLPMAIVASSRLGGFGVHPSLLPRWRGPDPYYWAIDAGDAATGVTAHRLAAEYDTGAILGARTVAIAAEWDAWRLSRALDGPSLELLCDVAESFARGETMVEHAQEEAVATTAPMPDESMLEIDWARDAAAVIRRVRAAAPYPGAWTFVGEEALVVTRAVEAPRPLALTSGEALVVDGRAVVAAGRGGVAVLAGRVIADDDSEHCVDASDIASLVLKAGCGRSVESVPPPRDAHESRRREGSPPYRAPRRRAMADEAVLYLDTFPDWLRTLARDAVEVAALVASDETPARARRLLAGGVNYLFKSLDLVPDGIEDIGFIDDAFVLRLAARQALAEPDAPTPEAGSILERLAREAAIVESFLGPQYPKLDAYVRELPRGSARGRSVEHIVGIPEVRQDFMDDVGAFARTYATPSFTRDERALVKLRAFLEARLPK